MSVRVASLCAWAKPGRASPPSLQVAALWGHFPEPLVAGALTWERSLCSALRTRAHPGSLPAPREGERRQAPPRIPERSREGPVDLEEVTISASREGQSPDPDLATAPPSTGHTWHRPGSCGWGETNVMGTAPGSGWRCSRPEADSGWAVWFGNPPLPPKEGTAWPVAAGQTVGRGRCRPTGIHVSAKSPSSTLKCISDPVGG